MLYSYFISTLPPEVRRDTKLRRLTKPMHQEDNKTSTTQEVNKTSTTQRSSWLHCLYACLFDLLSYMQLLLFLPPTSVCGCPCSLHVPSPNPPHCRRLSPSASDLPAESSPVKGALVYKRCPIILPFLPLTC